MIVFTSVTARSKRATIASLSMHLGPGLFALVGGDADGAPLVLALAAGAARAKRGAVRVLDRDAGDDEARASIAYVPRDAALPEPARVAEVLAMAASLRNEAPRDPAARLDALGIASLVDRDVRTLWRDEARAVALAEALTSEARVVLVEEPLASIDPRAAARVVPMLRARAQRGACVVASCASLADARTVAAEIVVFDRGALVRGGHAADPFALVGARGAAVYVVASDAARLAAAVASIDGAPVASTEVDGTILVARGADPAALSAAITRASRDAGVAIQSMRPLAPSASEVRGHSPRDRAPLPATAAPEHPRS